MALIQVNQKLLHITITLLIYGVRIESVRCPEYCHCVKTSVFYNSNSTKTDFDILDISDKFNYQHLDVNKRSLRSSEVTEVSRVTDKKRSSSCNVTRRSEIDNGKQNKTSKNKKNVKDIFIPNFSTDSVENFLIKNSKEIRIKRTLKLNANDTSLSGGGLKQNLNKTRPEVADNALNKDKFSSDAKELEKPRNLKDKKRVKEIFTYQITCNEVRDLKALWFQDLPNPTTQLIIQQAYFQSVKTFHQILKESSTKLNQLTDLSVTNCIINQKTDENHSTITESPAREIPLRGKKEFLPFASLQNPTLRSKDDESATETETKSKHLQILNLSNNTLTHLPPDTFDRFPNLQTLDLSGNLIGRLDDETFASLTNLLRLDVHNNKLESLNEVLFKNLTKLLTLDVSQNLISNIAPSTFQYLTSLNTLILADNPLSTKQEAMILLGTGKRLQIVDASRTGLKQIPGMLERSVRTLNLKGNYLSSIQCGDLDSYSLLTYLNLRDNKISYVEDDALGRLELLNNLQINENNLFQIPKSLPNNLEILNLSYNNIQNITNSDFLNLSLLKELSLSYNQISNIEDNSFENLVELKVLDLSHNPILILPNVYLAKLTSLNLSYFTNIPNNFNNKYEEFPTQSPQSIRILNLESSPILTKIFLQDTKTLQSFDNLRELHLRFSNLTTLRKDMFALLPKLEVLKIEGNPWHCERDILQIADWLRSHEKTTQVDDEDEINTAHCATPFNLHKKPLITLSARDFEAAQGEDPARYMEIEKLNAKNIFKNQMTLKKIQEIQSKDRIYLKSFEKPIDYSDKKIEDMSNTSRRNQIDFAEAPGPGETKIKKDKGPESDAKLLLNYNKTEHKRVISDGRCCAADVPPTQGTSLLASQQSSAAAHFSADKSVTMENGSETTAAWMNVTEFPLDDTHNGTEENVTQSILVGNATEEMFPGPTTEPHTKARTEYRTETRKEPYTEAHTESHKETQKEPYAEAHTESHKEAQKEPYTEAHTESHKETQREPYTEAHTESHKEYHTETQKEPYTEAHTEPHVEASPPQAGHVKETLSSEKQPISHPGMFVLFFVGFIMIVTLAVTFLHFAKSRRDRNYQRQSQDIEVRSISSLGNELW